LIVTLKEKWKKSTTCYLLEKSSDNRTKLTLDFYVKKNIAMQTIFKLVKKKKMEADFHKSLQNLEELVKQIKLPVEV
jgi:predicted secreted protein